MGEAGRAILAIVSSVIGLSLVAVVLSTRANTASVISAGGQALSGVIGAATAPVTGGSTSVGSAIGAIGANAVASAVAPATYANGPIGSTASF